MPKITLPATFVAGDTAGTANKLSNNVYQAQAVPQTLDVINGHLTRANLETNCLPLDSQTIRRRDNVLRQTRGATVNFDYFYDWFNPEKTVGTAVAVGPPGRGDPTVAVTPDIELDNISVHGITYLVPWGDNASKVRIHGEIGFACATFLEEVDPGSAYFETTEAWDMAASGLRGTLSLFVDDYHDARFTKLIPAGTMMMRKQADAYRQNISYLDYWQKSSQTDIRWWTFDAVYGTGEAASAAPPGARSATAAGFHTASIRLHHRARLVRVYARNLTVTVER